MLWASTGGFLARGGVYDLIHNFLTASLVAVLRSEEPQLRGCCVVQDLEASQVYRTSRVHGGQGNKFRSTSQQELGCGLPTSPVLRSFYPDARVVKPEGNHCRVANPVHPPSLVPHVHGGGRDTRHPGVRGAQRARRARLLSGPNLPSGRPAPSTPARPRPRSFVAPAGGPLTRMPCSTRTRSSSSIPNDTLRASLLSVLPMTGGERAGGHATRLQSNRLNAELQLPMSPALPGTRAAGAQANKAMSYWPPLEAQPIMWRLPAGYCGGCSLDGLDRPSVTRDHAEAWCLGGEKRVEVK